MEHDGRDTLGGAVDPYSSGITVGAVIDLLASEINAWASGMVQPPGPIIVFSKLWVPTGMWYCRWSHDRTQVSLEAKLQWMSANGDLSYNPISHDDRPRRPINFGPAYVVPVLSQKQVVFIPPSSSMLERSLPKDVYYAVTGEISRIVGDTGSLIPFRA